MKGEIYFSYCAVDGKLGIREHLEVSGTKAVFAVYMVAGEGQISLPGQAALLLGARAGSEQSESPREHACTSVL